MATLADLLPLIVSRANPALALGGPFSLVQPLPKSQTNVSVAPVLGAHQVGWNPADMLNAVTNASQVGPLNQLRGAQTLSEQLKNQQALDTLALARRYYLGQPGAPSANDLMRGQFSAFDFGAPAPQGAQPQPQPQAAPAMPRSGAEVLAPGFQPPPVTAPQLDPHAADPLDEYARRVAMAEAGGNANARNPNSSATGLGQFTDATWLDLARRYVPEAASLDKDALLALRNDPGFSHTLIKNYAAENAGALQQAELPVDMGSLYLAHMLGPEGAVSVLRAQPTTPLSKLLSPAALKANPQWRDMTAADLTALAGRHMGGAAQGAAAAPAAGAAPASPEQVGQAAAAALAATPQGSAGAPPLPSPQAAATTVTPGGVPFGALGPRGAPPGAVNPLLAQVIGLKYLGLQPSPVISGLAAASMLPPGPAQQLATAAAVHGAGIAPFLGGERPGVPIRQFNPVSGQYEIAAQNPRLPEGAVLAPNGAVSMAPGATQAIAAAQAAQQWAGVGPALAKALKFERVVDPVTGQERWVLMSPLTGGPVGAGAAGAAGNVAALGPGQVETLRGHAATLGKEYGEAVDAFNSAQKSLPQLLAIEGAMRDFRTGPSAATRLRLEKAWQDLAQTVGLDPGSDLAKTIASGEIINKSGTFLGFNLARSLGSREAQMIVQQAIATNPGLANSPQGNETLLRLIGSGLQRDIDRRQFFDNWFAEKHTYDGAATAFNRAAPVGAYISKTLPYHPKSAADYAALPDGSTFVAPDGTMRQKPSDPLRARYLGGQ